MSRLDDARLDITNVIITSSTGLPATHVTAYPPSQLVAPAAYVDMPRVYNGELGTMADWPIVIVADGDDWAQMARLDSAVAILWDSFNATDGWECADASPVPKDVGGPSLRAYQLTLTTFLTLDVLCPSLSTLTSV